jgi:NADPH:quinone reductase-like Zn-dependent oxidoreductase
MPTMRGWWVREFGGPERMQWADLPALTPGPSQLRVRVHASGINFAETRMRAGTYSGQELPFVMGMESAGVVEAVGASVAGYKPGDRVFGRARGSHAETVLLDAEHALPLPNNLSFAEGAAIPVGWL